MRKIALIPALAIGVASGFYIGAQFERTIVHEAYRRIQADRQSVDWGQLHTVFECSANGQTWCEGIGYDGSYTCHSEPAERVPVRQISSCDVASMPPPLYTEDYGCRYRDPARTEDTSLKMRIQSLSDAQVVLSAEMGRQAGARINALGHAAAHIAGQVGLQEPKRPFPDEISPGTRQHIQQLEKQLDRDLLAITAKADLSPVLTIPAGTVLHGTYDGFKLVAPISTTTGHLRDDAGHEIDIPLVFSIRQPLVACPEGRVCSYDPAAGQLTVH